ncbi:MAG: LURP-one-related family protein [Promethearchaeota archaeon]
MHCPNCGIKVNKEGQRFCEHCGTELPVIASLSSSQAPENLSYINQTQDAPYASYNVPGGLFDINRNYYIFKEKMWDMGSGDILDENGNLIGKMKRKILSIRRRVSLLELDGTVSAVIHAKIISARGAQELKDPEGNLIAKIKKKILSFFKPKFYLEDPEGNRWFEAIGKFMGWSFKVYDITTGEVVAEIEKADRWRDVFLKGIFDRKDTYALRILDNQTDRRILAGFVLSIDNILHDS